VTIRKTALVLLLVVFIALIGWVLSWSVPLSSPDEPVTLVLGGDFYGGERLRNYGLPNRPGKFTGGFPGVIRQSDLHIVNLEAPLTTRTDTSTSKSYWLRTPPDVGKALLDGLSVDAVSLANNHVLDYGEEGLYETIHHLEESGIRHAGAGHNHKSAASPVFFERHGQTLAFLAFSNTYPQSFWASAGKAGTAYGDPGLVRSRVKQAKKRADRVVVSFHWGEQTTRKPKNYQQQLARLTIRAGADVVFGHHPHTLQPVEQYRDGLIFYSLGNYFFSTLSRDVQYGLLAEVRFPAQPSPPDYRLHLMNINNYEVHYRPQYVGGFDGALGVGVELGRLGFFRRRAQFSDRTGASRSLYTRWTEKTPR
jgi:poly-gamma-glutamate synthesis protein (capsule biosynthesis protein)